MFSKILVCLDGSSLAEQVLPYATEVAGRFGSKIILLQVITMPTIISGPEEPGPIVGLLEQVKQEQAVARAYLEKIAKPLQEKGLEVECVTLQGVPGESIVAYAEKNGVDLVTIATHGRSGLKRLVFGSVAEYLMKHFGLPILIVRPK